ncbi:hypothetical protein J0S82_016691 [Galemys pyrenaicus]|uniref:Uncharacterized protein n=1 Tax=Galemys pyrenaicus TaxID=202257 RepID=A0A8J5ZH32_GALPY|nr:hypothetical protein J0S82_016691 [Galemys pyrenaicus]
MLAHEVVCWCGTMNTHGRPCLIPTSTGILKRRKFRVKGGLQLLSLLLLSLRWQTGMKVCRCPLCVPSSSLY